VAQLFAHLDLVPPADDPVQAPHRRAYAVVDGVAQRNDFTVIHNRSIAEDVRYLRRGEPFIPARSRSSTAGCRPPGVTVSGLSLLHSVPLTAEAFKRSFLGDYGQYAVTIGLVMFAFSTALAWSYYGDRGITYLIGLQAVTPYRIVYVLGFFLATIVDTSLIWLISAVTLAMMAIPNLIGIMLMRRRSSSSPPTTGEVSTAVNFGIVPHATSSRREGDMPLRVTFDLEDKDLKFFRASMQQAKRRRSTHQREGDPRRARRDGGRGQGSGGACIRAPAPRPPAGAHRHGSGRGVGAGLPGAQERAAALAYFADPQDMIPDNIPVLGYIDDAIMIELVVSELKHEIDAFEDFCRYRARRALAQPQPQPVPGRVSGHQASRAARPHAPSAQRGRVARWPLRRTRIRLF
jgi:hypothetical protein